MTRRTDIHRPSAIVPADYDFIGFNYLPTDRDLSGIFPAFNDRALIRAHMQRTGGTWSGHEHAGNCHICGAHCIYTATFHHRPTNVYIRCGLTCTDGLEMDSGAGERFRKAVRAAIEARAGVRKAKALCEEHGVARAYDYFERARRPIMDEGEALVPENFTEYEERTIIDVVGKLAKYGSISDRQWSFIAALLGKIDTRPQRLAQRAQELASALDVPVSDTRMVVEGEVVSTKVVEGPYGNTTKMLVKHVDGWKVWGTRPSSLDVQRGDRVRFTALVTRSDRDPKFGFFSRPVVAPVTTVAAVVNTAADEEIPF